MTALHSGLIRALDRSAAVLRRLGLGPLTRLGRVALDRLLRRGVYIESQGVRLVGGVRDRAFLYRVEDGTFEPQTVRVLRQVVRPGMVMLDVGAYLGYYTILASRAAGPQGRVYAFEPDPSNFRWLRYNLSINGCDNVAIFQRALSSSPGTGHLYRHATDPSKSSLAAREGWGQRIQAELDTADRLVDAPFVDLVKIDVEGAEPFVLKGMAGLLMRTQDPILLVESNPRALEESGSSADELLQLLKMFGFTLIERLDEEVDHTGNLQLCNLYCRRSTRSQ